MYFQNSKQNWQEKVNFFILFDTPPTKNKLIFQILQIFLLHPFQGIVLIVSDDPPLNEWNVRLTTAHIIPNQRYNVQFGQH